MSKSIWHTADETPKAERYFIEHYKVVVGDKVYWKYGLFKGISDYDYPFDQDTARWCYLDDLLALEPKLERTRKALETLQEFITKLYLSGKITDEQLERYKKMLITALEQKDVK